MAKDIVEDTRKIDINWLMRNGQYKVGNTYCNQGITWTIAGCCGETKNDISYNLDLSEKNGSKINIYYIKIDGYSGEKTKINYWVNLTTTGCHFGGHRYWFLCPSLNCGKRVGALYFGEKYFLCRHCLNLSYKTRNDKKRFRLLGKMFDCEGRAEELANILWGKYGKRFYGGKFTKRYKKYIRLCDMERKVAFEWLQLNKMLEENANNK